MPTQHYEQGTYKAKTKGQRFGVTPTKTPYFALEFEPFESTSANALPDQIYTRELTLYFSEAAMPHSIKRLRAIGWTGDTLAELDPTMPQWVTLEDIEIEVSCSHNEKGYEDWDLVGASGEEREAMKGVAAKLDRLYGKAIKSDAPKKATPLKPAPAPEPAPAPAAQDEIPF